MRVLVLSPFRYIYGSKNFFINTGEHIELDVAKPAGLEELKFILSPMCEYKEWLYIESSPLVDSLKAQIKAEYEGVALLDSNPQQQEDVITETFMLTAEPSIKEAMMVDVANIEEIIDNTDVAAYSLEADILNKAKQFTEELKKEAELEEPKAPVKQSKKAK